MAFVSHISEPFDTVRIDIFFSCGVYETKTIDEVKFLDLLSDYHLLSDVLLRQP